MVERDDDRDDGYDGYANYDYGYYGHHYYYDLSIRSSLVQQRITAMVDMADTESPTSGSLGRLGPLYHRYRSDTFQLARIAGGMSM